MMSNEGRVEIKFLTDTKELEKAETSVKELSNEIEKGLGGSSIPNASKPIQDIGKSATNSQGGVKGLVTSLGLLKVGAMALNAITDSMDAAISRVDTMNQYPRMLQQMGFSATEAESSIDRLSDGIQGLPTRLDEVVGTTQRFVTTFKDVDLATETTLALNNALLASGAGAQEASNTTDQYVKMLSSGKIEMDAWNTLSENMNYALVEVAESMGIADGNVWELYSSLQSGSMSLEEFNQALIETSQAEGGFADMALTASEGIATSMSNIRTAIVTGVANAIQALDELITELTGTNIAGHMNNMKNVVADAFKGVANAIRGARPHIQTLMSILSRLSPVIAGVATAFAAFKIITTVTAWFQNYQLVVRTLSTTKAAYLGITKALTLAEVNATVAQKALAIATGLFTGNIAVATAATKLFSGAIAFLTGPLGIALIAIGAITAGLVAMYKAFNTPTPEMEKLNDELDDAAEKSSNLTEKIDANSTAFDESLTSIEASKNAHKDMADQLDKLVGKEEKSATDKAMIQGYVEALNGSIDGLNLAYDEEAEKLNLGTEAIHAKIDAYAELEKSRVAQERQIEIIQELAEAEIQLETNTRLLKEAQTELDDQFAGGFFGNSELKDNISELESENESLKATIGELGTEYEVTTDILTQATEAQAAAVEESTERQKVALSDLSADQQAVIGELQDYYTGLKDHTQNMFDEIDDTIMTTNDVGDEVAKTSEQIFAEMQATLEHNQEVVATWADNMQELANRGVDEGLLEELARLGPEGAPYVQALVDASDEELANLSDTFATGGEAALEALQQALGLEDFEIEGLENIITNAEESLREQIDSSGLDQIGADIVDGVSQGITDNTANAETAATDMATATLDAHNAAAGVASPSTKYMAAAADMVQGAVNGINNNKMALVSAARMMALEAVEAFRGVTPSAESAGQQLGRGFQSGLASMRNSVVNTAIGIANAAAAAINKALDIRSPSRKGFYSGEMLGEGVDDGMESKYKDIERTAKGLAQRALPVFAPININRFLDIPTSTPSLALSGGGQSQVTDLSRTNELLERIYRKNPNLVADDGTVLGHYTNKFDRENGILFRNMEERRL